jgi:hypothetical protein
MKPGMLLCAVFGILTSLLLADEGPVLREGRYVLVAFSEKRTEDPEFVTIRKDDEGD